MCGILVSNENLNLAQAEARLQKIGFRGPNRLNINKVDKIILGHLRLSIIDLDPRSDQPMIYDDFHIVYNGEIYNFKDLKNTLLNLGYNFKTESDTETILVGYKHWGKNVVDHLDGMFAFIILDRKKNILFGARDRLGVKPLYYSFVNGIFEACSQLRPIANGKKISQIGLSIYYDLGYIPAPFSVFENVHKLKPGNCLELDLSSKKLKTWSFWDIENLSHQSYKSTNKDEVLSILKDSVKKRLVSDVPLGVFLSGGIDSTLVAKIAKDEKTNLTSYTVGFESEKFDETKRAKIISKKINLKNQTSKFSNEDLVDELKRHVLAFDEPFSDVTSLGTLLVNKKASKKIIVALSGDGGDESFFGYNHFLWLKLFLYIEILPKKIRSYLSKFFIRYSENNDNQRFFNIGKILEGSRADLMKNIFLGFDRLSLNKDSWYEQHFQKYLTYSSCPYQQLSDLNIKLWLEGDSNVKVDRASMAYSLEVRSPFLDYKLIENLRKIKLKFRFRKKILKDILTDFGFNKGFFDKKKGFSMPIEDWTKIDLKEMIITELTDEFLNSLPKFNVIKFKKMLNKHMNSNRNYSDYIWRIFILKLWYNDFNK